MHWSFIDFPFLKFNVLLSAFTCEMIAFIKLLICFKNLSNPSITDHWDVLLPNHLHLFTRFLCIGSSPEATLCVKLCKFRMWCFHKQTVKEGYILNVPEFDLVRWNDNPFWSELLYWASENMPYRTSLCLWDILTLEFMLMNAKKISVYRQVNMWHANIPHVKSQAME